MLHKHIQDTLQGIVSTIGAIFFGAVSLAKLGTIIGIFSGVIGLIASLFAIRYYYFATKKINKK